MAMTDSVSHLPQRPTWMCGNCGLPWPCGAAKARLVAEFVDMPTVLRVYLAAQLGDAAVDLHDPALHARFLGWLPPRR